MPPTNAHYLTTLVLCLFTLSLQAQAPAFFETIHGSPAYTEKNLAVRQLPDGSIYAAGTAIPGILGGADFTLSKYSPNGVLLWTKYLGNTLNDQCSYMIVTNDGSLLLVGDTENPAGDTDGLLIKTDTSGNVLFTSRTPASGLTESLAFVQQTQPDNGFITIGMVSDTLGGAVGNNCYLVKFSEQGEVLWQQNYGGMHNDVAYMVRQTADGGLVFTGDTQSFNDNNNVDIWVVKTNAEGVMLWDLVIGDEWANGIKSLMVTAQNDFFLTGETVIDETGYFDIVLARVSQSGQLVWYKTWGIPASTEAAFSALQTADNGFLITGYSNLYRPGYPIKLLLLKTDDQGNEMGVTYFGGTSINLGYDIQPAVYGNYLIGGFTFVGPDSQFFLIYTNEPAPTATPPLHSALPFEVKLAPYSGTNSAAPTLLLTVPQAGNLHLHFYNLYGQQLTAGLPQTHYLPHAGNHQIPLLLPPGATNGLYFCELRFTDTQGKTYAATQKIMVGLR
ncbi:MAG TPA: hypothetical protein PK239_13715 [Chitinophagales bacterium]|nr:hypothetical protein [Chitinophagales bacterium]HRK28327.1 hypothetical protein [Chitinophagales bacterium]